METAGSATGPQASNTHPLVHVRQRVEALRLLGYIGSRESISFLTNVFIKDPDSSVKAAAAEAIGRIGVDPDGIAMRAFSTTATAASQVKEEQVLTAAAAAIGSLCRFSGPPLSDSGVKLLSILGSGNMPPKTQSQARRELSQLR
jgi:outer membrane protein assembly factor BamB